MMPRGLLLLLAISLVCCGTFLSTPLAAAPLDEPLKPLPDIPVQDPRKVELGRQLFNEKQLSINGTTSCASCHHLDHGGVDDKPFSIGFQGDTLGINTPSVLNAALNFKQFWNGRAETLEAQIEGVVKSPTEMGNNWPHVVDTLNQAPTYKTAFQEAYTDGVTIANVQNALAPTSAPC